MRTVLICSLLSAFLGAMFALVISQGVSQGHANQLPMTEVPAFQQPVYQEPELQQQSNLRQRNNLGVVNDVDGERRFSQEEQANISVYENVNRSVVNIDTKSNRPDMWFLGVEPDEGSGSGWVLDREGHIVTNYHVIAGSDFVSVTLFEGDPLCGNQ